MQINGVFCDYLSLTDNQQQTTVMIFLQGRVSVKVSGTSLYSRSSLRMKQLVKQGFQVEDLLLTH